MALQNELAPQSTRECEDIGRDLPREGRMLVPWLETLLGTDSPAIFPVRVKSGKVCVWGYIYLPKRLFGYGVLEMPVSFDDHESEFPGFDWMIDANKKSLDFATEGSKIFALLGLEYRRQYGEVSTSSSRGSFLGMNHAVCIERDPSQLSIEPWRDFRNKAIPQQGERWWRLRSAIDLKNRILRDVPHLTIAPQPFRILLSDIHP